MISNYYLLGAVLAVMLLIVLARAGFKAPRAQDGSSKISGALEGFATALAAKQTWPLAIINADKMVDDAPKARRYKGKPWHERLVPPNAT